MSVSPLKLVVLAVLGFVAYKLFLDKSTPGVRSTITSNPNTANNNVGAQQLGAFLAGAFKGLLEDSNTVDASPTNAPTL
jgi:hypothetical protein